MLTRCRRRSSLISVDRPDRIGETFPAAAAAFVIIVGSILSNVRFVSATDVAANDRVRQQAASHREVTQDAHRDVTPDALLPESASSNIESPEAVVIDGRSLSDWQRVMSSRALDDPLNAALVPGLLALVNRSDVPWQTRRTAALTLARWKQHPELVLPVMRTWLAVPGDDPETGPQRWVLKSLGLWGPIAEPFGPAVAEIARNDSATFLNRLTAIDTLSQLGPSSPHAVETLIAIADNRLNKQPDDRANSPTESRADDHADRALQQAAIEALGTIGPAAAATLPLLLRHIEEDDDRTRRLVCETLGRWGPRSEPATPMLVERLLVDADPTVRDAAAMALQQIGPELAPQLVELLERDEPALKVTLLECLGAWKAASRGWLPKIEHLWSDSHAEVRLAALSAARRIAPTAVMAQRTVPRLVAELTDADRPVRRRAVAELAAWGSLAENARPQLKSLIVQGVEPAATAARIALRSLDAAAEREAQ
jgi:HEAT repeat protein